MYLSRLTGERQKLPSLGVSPDGRRLYRVFSFVLSAGRRIPTVLEVSNLETSKTVDVNYTAPSSADYPNYASLDSLCWLDIHTLAVSGAVFPEQDGSPQAPIKPYTLVLLEADTGKLLRRVPGATSVSCAP